LNAGRQERSHLGDRVINLHDTFDDQPAWDKGRSRRLGVAPIVAQTFGEQSNGAGGAANSGRACTAE
jgi:hypothetical protein